MLGLGLGLGFTRDGTTPFLSQFPGASAAYSLRQLAQSSTAVVRVRRDSDDAEQDFTAGQVSGSSLTDWVNTVVINEEPDWSSGTDGWSNFTGGATASRVASYTDVDGLTLNDVCVSSGGETNNFAKAGTSRIGGNQYRLTGWVLADQPGTLNSISLGSWNAPTTVSQADVWTPIDVTFTPNDSGTWNMRFYQDSTAESVVRFADLKFEQVTANGHVTTWYDQQVPTSQDRMYFDGEPTTYVLLGSSFTISASDNFNLKGTFVFDTNGDDGTGVGNGLYGNSANSLTGYWIPTTLDSIQVTTDAGDLRDITLTNTFALNTVYTIEIKNNGGNYQVIVNGVDWTSGSHAVEDVTIDEFGLSRGRELEQGTMYDVSYSIDGSEVHLWNGYGNTNADWEDQVGSNNGTVNGSPQRCLSDLSVISKDATQTTAANQPLIVENGALVTENGKPAIDFDGTDDGLDIEGYAPESINYYCAFVGAIEGDQTTQKNIFDSTSAATGGFALAYGTHVNKLTPYAYFDGPTGLRLFTGGSNVGSSQRLLSVQYKSGASANYIDGAENSTTLTIPANSTWTGPGSNIFTKSTIGYDQTNSGRNIQGPAQEIIIYDSDQSANRADIETNINNFYGVY